MTTETEILNRALLSLGDVPVTSIDDNVKSAKTFKSVRVALRQEVLRSGFWSFARTSTTLSALVTPPDNTNWSYQFQMPSDLLRLIAIDVEPEFEIVGRIILCNATTIQIIYTKDVTDVAQFDSLFCAAYSAYAAHEMCVALTNSNQLKQQLWQEYQMKVKQARFVNASELDIQGMRAEAFDKARLSGPVYFETDPLT